MMLEQGIDREVLAAIFASRIALAKKTVEQAMDEAREEHARNLKWIMSPAQVEKSFLWFCDVFELDPSAVRRAMQKR